MTDSGVSTEKQGQAPWVHPFSTFHRVSTVFQRVRADERAESHSKECSTCSLAGDISASLFHHVPNCVLAVFRLLGLLSILPGHVCPPAARAERHSPPAPSAAHAVSAGAAGNGTGWCGGWFRASAVALG